MTVASNALPGHSSKTVRANSGLVHNLVYTSRGAVGVDAIDELNAIEERATARNRESDVHGILIHHDGWFIQWLQGDADAVIATMNRIRLDDRHTDITVVHEGTGPASLTRPWSMFTVHRNDSTASVERRMLSLIAQAANATLPPHDLLRNVAFPHHSSQKPLTSEDRPVVISGAGLIWPSAVIHYVATLYAVPTEKTLIKSREIEEREALIEYVQTPGGTRVIATTTAASVGGHIEPVYHNASLIVFLIRPNRVAHKIELLRRLLSIQSVAEQRTKFVFAFSNAAAIDQPAFLAAAEALKVNYTALVVTLADAAKLWSLIQSELAQNALGDRVGAPDTTMTAAKHRVISPAIAGPEGQLPDTEPKRTLAAAPDQAPMLVPNHKATLAPLPVPAQLPHSISSPDVVAGPLFPTVYSTSKLNQGDIMSDTAESLKSILTIDGALGCALVDIDSGMTLGTAGGGINLEVAAAGNTEVIRAKMRVAKQLGLEGTIEDMLITLATQYHLIRPLASRKGLFLYVVIDRSKGNLAMARFKLSEIESQLSV